MRVPADGKDGECCPKYVSRIETGVHVRCVVEGIIFGICNLKIGVCNATCWAFVSREVFSGACPQFQFLWLSFYC